MTGKGSGGKHSAIRLACALLLAPAIGTLPAARGGRAPLDASVAVSLRPAVEAAAHAWESLGYAVDVRLNSGASSVLLQQARRGAPADLLISASPKEIDDLVAEGLADPASRRRIASNRLVVVVPSGRPAPRSLEELAQPDFGLVAVGNPRTAPVGRYARQALEPSGLWGRLESRRITAQNARQVLDYVARGEVAAGILYRTDALMMPDRVTVAFELSADLHEGIAYEGVVLTDASRPGDAAAFLNWLASDSGSAILERHGFLPCPAGP